MLSLAERWRALKDLERAFAASEGGACHGVEIARSSKRPASGRTEGVEWVAAVDRLPERYPRFGDRKIFDRRQMERWRVGGQVFVC